jgi:probable phosphoglycerate mutase
LGVRTNNVAEYAGLVLALREARRLGAEEIDLRLDSKLIVEQLNGRWRVKDAKLQGLFAEARRHLATFVRWSATHEPRERNRAADALANLALDDPEAAALLVAEVARRNGREPTPPPAVDTPSIVGARAERPPSDLAGFDGSAWSDRLGVVDLEPTRPWDRLGAA